MKFLAYLLAVVLFFLLVTDLRTPMDYGQQRIEKLSSDIDEFSVGVIWPFSSTGFLFRQGVLLAAEEINSAGGLGRKMEVVFRDTASKESVAYKAAREFIQNESMVAVLGHYETGIAEQNSVGYENAKLLFMTTGASGSSLTEHNFDYLIRTNIKNRAIAKNMVKALKERGYKKVFIVTQEDEYGRDLNFHFQYHLDLQDLQLSGTSSYFRWETHFKDIIYHLQFDDSDLVFLSGYEPWAAYFLRDMRDMGLTLPFAGAFTAEKAMRNIAGEALNGAMFFTSYDVEAKDPKNRVFVKKFVERYGEKPDVFAATGYDTLHMLAYAIQATGSLDPLDLSYFFKYIMDYDGVNGEYRFTPNGEVKNRPFYLKQVQGDRSVILWSNN